jgi:hypothetical protein
MIALISAAMLVQVSAAPITWGSSSTISSDADVSTLGSLDRAFNLGGTGVPVTTVNGVTFASFAYTSGSSVTVGNTSLVGTGGMGADNAAFGFAAPPFSSLSSNYQTLLQSAIFANGSLTLTLSGLVVGQTYLFQWWVNDSRGFDGGQRQTRSTATDSATLEHNVQNADGGVGQFVIGTFVADSTSQQVIVFDGLDDDPGNPPGAVSQINAFQLRVIPEPSSIILFAFGGALCLHRLARRRK